MATDDPRIIKRYANRKLYDTTRREFTSLDDLSGLLDKGIRFVVQEHDSGEDRTETVLAQVLGRRVRSGKGSGSTDLLSGLLRAPTQIAEQLLADQSAKQPDQDDAKPKKKKKKKDGSKKPDSGKATGKKSDAKKASGPKSAEVERQEAEIAELRSQVAELTQAVSMLVNDKLAERDEA